MRENFGINDGHTISGPGSGAIGFIVEGEHTRLVGNEVRRLLQAEGQGVFNCTVDKAATTNQSLELVVNQANREELDWFISIHFNAGGGQGVEVYTYEGRQYQDAIDVCKNISALGFKNRGVKAGTGFYVIRKTKAKSMLIEVCFVDTDDANKYLNIGHKAIAKAIVEGVLNKKINENQTITSNWVLDLQKELNRSYNSKLVEDGIIGAKTISACPVLKQGAKGNVVKLLQKRLIEKGFNCGSYGADGSFGNGTRIAVVNFQKSKNLNIDGIVGKNTWSKL